LLSSATSHHFAKVVDSLICSDHHNATPGCVLLLTMFETSRFSAAKQFLPLPSASLVVAASGECNDTLHDELVQSVTQQVNQDAPPEVQDNIVVQKGNCTEVSCRLCRVRKGLKQT
jgi:hypothetical protein